MLPITNRHGISITTNTNLTCLIPISLLPGLKFPGISLPTRKITIPIHIPATHASMVTVPYVCRPAETAIHIQTDSHPDHIYRTSP